MFLFLLTIASIISMAVFVFRWTAKHAGRSDETRREVLDFNFWGIILSCVVAAISGLVLFM